MIAKILVGSFFISLFGAAFSLAIAMLFTLYFIGMKMSPFAASATSMFMSFVCFTNSAKGKEARDKFNKALASDEVKKLMK